MTVAGLLHGIYRADSQARSQRRRRFIDDLKRCVPVHPGSDETGEIIGRISGQQESKGIRIPFADLAIGASALEQGYAVATLNRRHFEHVPGLLVMPGPTPIQ